jgi:hypothetical protein
MIGRQQLPWQGARQTKDGSLFREYEDFLIA